MIVGAVAAAGFLRAGPPDIVYAALIVVVISCAAATAGSRWYITSAFTTFLVFVMLLRGHLDETTAKVNERVGETILGVAAAYVFGWFVPVLRARLDDRRQVTG